MATKADTLMGIVITDGRQLEVPNVVRVAIPASIAFNLDKFTKVHKGILDRLGCRACTSGFDIRYDMHRDFAVDDKLRILER